MALKRGKRWQANVRLKDGRRLRPSFASEKEALAWEAAAKYADESGKAVPRYRETRPQAPVRDLATLGGILDHVERTEWIGMKASASLIRNGRQVCDYFGRARPVGEIGPADIAEMKLHFSRGGLSPASVNRRVAALSKLLRVAREVGTITVQPIIKWNREEQSRFRYLDREEEGALLAYWQSTGDTDMHDLTVLLVDTGARCWSEMRPVRWDAFGPDFSAVTFWHTKTGRPRTVPLTVRSRGILLRRREQFRNASGPFSTVNQWTMVGRWKAMRLALGLHDVTPHTLRHTCCTRLVLGGVDVKRVMTWMGHSAIVTTMRYMQIKPTALEDVLHVLE